MVAIVGSGPTALFISYALVKNSIDVMMFDQTTEPSKKLLFASKSGLNISTDIPISQFTSEYKNPRMAELISDFDLDSLKNWINEIGLTTYIGNGNKVFLKESGDILIKTIFNFLNSSNHFSTKFSHKLIDWNKNRLLFNTDNCDFSYSANSTVFCLGGASWPLTGSNGFWIEQFKRNNIKTYKLNPANCGFKTEWSPKFNYNYDHIKDILLSYNGRSKRGDIVIKKEGIEGSPIYYFSREICDRISNKERAIIDIDLLPELSINEIVSKLNKARSSDSITNKIRKSLKLSKIKIDLFNELSQRPIVNKNLNIASLLKNLKLQLLSPENISEAISSSGGISFSALDKNLMLKKFPGFYCGGEMINWDAPTGGYLIHGCLATAYRISNAIIKNTLHK